MADPKQLTILEALQTRLELIHPVNGYNTDAGDQVTLGLSAVNPDQIQKGPLIQVDSTSDAVIDEGGTSCGDYLVEVDYTVRCMTTATTGEVRALHLLIQDCKQAILTTDSTFSGDALRTYYVSRETSPPERGGDIIGADLTFSVQLLESYGDP